MLVAEFRCRDDLLNIVDFRHQLPSQSSGYIIHTLLGIPALSQAMSGQHGINDEKSRTYVEYGPAYGKDIDTDIDTDTMFYQRVRSPARRRKSFGGFGPALSDHYSNGLGLDDLSLSNWLA